jgi:hypothetical protein
LFVLFPSLQLQFTILRQQLEYYLHGGKDAPRVSSRPLNLFQVPIDGSSSSGGGGNANSGGSSGGTSSNGISVSVRNDILDSDAAEVVISKVFPLSDQPIVFTSVPAGLTVTPAIMAAATAAAAAFAAASPPLSVTTLPHTNTPTPSQHLNTHTQHLQYTQLSEVARVHPSVLLTPTSTPRLAYASVKFRSLSLR